MIKSEDIVEQIDNAAKVFSGKDRFIKVLFYVVILFFISYPPLIEKIYSETLPKVYEPIYYSSFVVFILIMIIIRTRMKKNEIKKNKYEYDYNSNIDYEFSSIQKYFKKYSLLKEINQILKQNRELNDSTIHALTESNLNDEIIINIMNYFTAQYFDHSKKTIIKTSIELIEKRGIGHHVINSLFEKGLDQRWKEECAKKFLSLKKRNSIIWAHKYLADHVKNDSYYNSFMEKFKEIIIKEAYDVVNSYLVTSDRGPAKDNAYTFYTIINFGYKINPFVKRFCEWINSGKFDVNNEEKYPPKELYKILNYADRNRKNFKDIFQTTQDYLYSKLRSDSIDDRKIGWSYLNAAIAEDFVDLNQLHENILSRIYFDRKSTEEILFFDDVENFIFYRIRTENKNEEKLSQLKKEVKSSYKKLQSSFNSDA